MGGPVSKRKALGPIVVVLAAVLLAVSPATAAVPAHGRAWELVTAGPTNGVNVIGARAWSEDGDRVIYLSFGPMPGAPSGDLVAAGLATRGPGGWSKQPIGEPFSVSTPSLDASEPVAIDGSLTSWVWRATQALLPGAPPAPQVSLYRRAPDGTLTLLGGLGDPLDSRFVATSDDAQHAAFESSAHLLPADAGRIGGTDAYEFAGSQLRLVGVDSAGVPLSACGSTVGNGEPTSSALAHAISRDGERIFFTAPVNGSCSLRARVYVRAHHSQTVELSASACSRPDCNAPADVVFAGATPDGSSAFMVTTQQLTDDDVDDSFDLYRSDVAGHALTRLSAGPPGVGAEVIDSIVRASDDGTRAYFIASGGLVPGQGTPGSRSIFLSDHGTLRFVAPADDVDLTHAAVSADGRMLAFATANPLLPSDIDTSIDVYRYDAQSGALQQLSLGDAGRGNDAFDVVFGEPGVFAPLQQDGMRYMSADGDHVAFVTSEPLLAADTNTTPDVYEWADGTLGLVSSGAGDRTVAYAGLSADGRSVFFTTAESLVSADRNGGDEDLYDARLGGGFPDSPPAAAPCEGDACQGARGPRLARPLPASLAYVEPSADLRIHALGRDARARLAASGRATVVVDVPAAGRVSLLARARIHGRAVAVARAATTARGAGSVRLHVRLSAAARELLQRGRPLRLTLSVHQAHRAATTALALRLRSAL